MDAIFRFDFKVPAEAVDGNGHVNNVAYVQWMQDAAIRHAEISGCTAVVQALGATWVARTHHVEYLRPAFGGEDIAVLTWVANFRKVTSLRKYKFLRPADGTLLVRAETDWVLVDAGTGRPRSIPDAIRNTLPTVSEAAEPGIRALRFLA